MLELNSLYRSKNPKSNNLLMHFDTLGAGGNFVDEYGHGVTASGASAIKSIRFKFGGSSLLSANDALRLNTKIVLLGDYTLECFMNIDKLPTSEARRMIFGNDQRPSDTSLAIQSASIGFWLPDSVSTGSTWGVLPNAASFVVNRWYHLAATRKDGFVRLFVDGAMLYSKARTFGEVIIDRLFWNSTYPVGHNSYFDEVRVLDGVCAYDSPFTPPTSPFTV